ncbi:MAG: YeeE/YedE family protein [Pseudomonadota bacterium]
MAPPDITSWLDALGEPLVLMIAGISVGMMFGIAAQQSQFCLRSASIAFWRGRFDVALSVWLLTFFTALFGVQLLVASGTLETGAVRQLTTPGTLSGAVIGGLMFGAGMILARGCASRLLVLSATGNLRALVTGLVLTIVAQASLRGVLSPARIEASSWWLIDADARGVLLAIPVWAPLTLALIGLGIAIAMAAWCRLSPYRSAMACCVGLAVVAGWGVTAWIGRYGFDIVSVKSISFTGPSADTLMALVQTPTLPLTFDTGLVPGVFAGSMIAAVCSRQFKLQEFGGDISLVRYLTGAVLMGFGGMLAGGCAVGAGVTGGSVLAATAWISLLAMWLAAGLTDAILDRPPALPESEHEPSAEAPVR